MIGSTPRRSRLVVRLILPALLPLGLVAAIVPSGSASAVSKTNPFASTAGAGTQSGSFGPIPYNGTEQSRCQGLSVGNHIVLPGHDVVATTSTGICGTAPKDISWSWIGVGGAVKSGCKANEKQCVFRAGSTNGQYVTVCIDGSNIQGPWESCDYYGTPSKGEGVVEGYVYDKSGNTVAGVDVTAYGKHSGGSTTGADGFYAMELHPGSYRVIPSGGPQGKSASRFLPGHNDTTVGDDTTGTANFVLQAEIELSLKFDHSTVPANGMSVVNGTITATEFGKPLPNWKVQLEVMPTETHTQAVTTAPKAAVCSNGTLQWPQGTISAPLGGDVDVTTGSNGQYPIAITVGTTPGTWSLEAWAFDTNGTLATDVTAASETKSIDFTSVGSTQIDAFVNELNTSEKATTTLQNANFNASPLVNALAQYAAQPPGTSALGGLGFALVNATDGQSMVVFPAAHPPTLNVLGTLNPSTGTNGSDLVYDPTQWSALTNNGLALYQALPAGGILTMPTLAEFDKGTSSAGWAVKKGNSITEFSPNFEYLGWGYPGLGAAGACY